MVEKCLWIEETTLMVLMPKPLETPLGRVPGRVLRKSKWFSKRSLLILGFKPYLFEAD